MPSKYCDRLPRCKNAWWCAIDYRPSENVKCFDAMTNYDRLVGKTPEELAVLISESIDCGVCEEMHGFRMCDAAPDKACEDCWCGWLRQEATV